MATSIYAPNPGPGLGYAPNDYRSNLYLKQPPTVNPDPGLSLAQRQAARKAEEAAAQRAALERRGAAQQQQLGTQATKENYQLRDAYDAHLLGENIAVRDKANAAAEARRLEQWKAMMGELDGRFGMGGDGADGSGGPGGPFDPNQPANAGAEEAIFARAKDQVALQNRASLNALRNYSAATNRLGSGFEGRAATRIIEGGNRQLGEVRRDQAIGNARRQAEVEDRNYAGALTKRAQDLSELQNRRQSLLSLSTSNGGVIY